MPIKGRCPKCRAPFGAPDEMLGRTGRCKRCGAKFPIRRDGGSSTETPTTIDRYEVRELLGRGTFGAVYRAFDPRLEREIALKVLRAEMTGSPESVQRFLREAKAAAKLTHPHIVPVYDAGRAGEVHFIAAAFIKGKTLSTAIRRGGVDQRWAAVLAAQLASALGYAHRQGVLHRDVKPANILLDEDGSLHLADFGLAGWTHEEATRLTREGALMGTPAYMAPEQASGELSRVGPAADIYSAGVVLYELLTGLPPFEGHAAALVYKILHVDVPPPSRRRPGLDVRLEAVCLKALAKEPERRYRSGEEMAAALQAVELPTSKATLQPARIEATTEYRPGAASVGVEPEPAGNAVTESDVSPIATPAPPEPAKVAPLAAPRVRVRRRWARWAVAAGAVLAGLAGAAVIWSLTHGPKPTPVADPTPVAGPPVIAPPQPAEVVSTGKAVRVVADELTFTVDGVDKTVSAPAGTQVLIDGKDGKLADIQKDSAVAVTRKDGVVVAIEVKSPPRSAPPGEMTLVGSFVRLENDVLVMTDADSGKEDRAAVPTDARVLIDGADGKLTDIKKGATVTISSTDARVASVEAKNPPKPSPAAAPFDAAEAKRLQQAWADYLGVPVVRDVDLGGGVTMKLVLIPPGTFQMGSPAWDKDADDGEKPQHKVTLTKPYYLGMYPVTQEQYVRVMGKENPSWFSKQGGAKDAVKDMETAKFPVEQVSWDDAAALCEALNDKDAKRPAGRKYGLPTEAQWEYACRAGAAAVYFFGDDPKELDDYAWYGANSGNRTHEVGTRKPNPWGLYDMHGNVLEWCADWYSPYKTGEITDPQYDNNGATRVLRGGSWDARPGRCRSASRDWFAPGGRNFPFGSRVTLCLD